MKITKKEANKSQVELSVEISVEELKPFLERAAQRLSQRIKIDGFRPGHVPYHIMKAQVGEAGIYEEAFHDVVEKTYPEALVQENLEVVGSPRVDIEKLAPGNPLIYKAVVSLMPTVTLGDYSKLKSERRKVMAGDEEIDKAMADLQNLRVKEKVVGREAKKGDRVEVDFDVFVDQVPIEGGKATKHGIILGDGHYIPGLEDAFVGMKKGDSKTTTIHFPKDYHQKSLAGRPAEFRLKLHEVYERELPVLDDQFAKDLGKFQNLEEMRAKLSENISKELQQTEDQRFELAVIEEVVEKSKISELPDTLIDYEIKKMISELEHDVQSQKGSFEDYLQSINKTREDLTKDFRERAVKRLRTALVAREIAVKEKVEASDEEVQKEIETTTRMYGDNPEAKKQFSSPAYRSYVKNILINRKVFDLLRKAAGEKV